MGHEAGKTPATVAMSGIRLTHDRIDALLPDHPHALTFLQAHGSVSRKTRTETARGNRDEDLPGGTPKQKSTEGFESRARNRLTTRLPLDLKRGDSPSYSL